MRRNGKMILVEQEVQKQMNDIKVEIKDQGKWTEVQKNKTLDDSLEDEGLC